MQSSVRTEAVQGTTQHQVIQGKSHTIIECTMSWSITVDCTVSWRMISVLCHHSNIVVWHWVEALQYM